MRVIAGTYRSRPLKSLKGQALRPTSDRLRETLFNVLGAGISESRFLDVFAGTGAVGIEALSRGATQATFIENHAPGAALIRKNLASLEISSGADVICADAVKGLATLQSGARQYDYIFIDPPYAATEDYPRVIKLIAASNILAPGGIVIVEHRQTFKIAGFFGTLRCVRLLRQSNAALSFYRRQTAGANETFSSENP
jgi:16S rRNA (guanine966-N2)-methyltransferase